MADSGHLIGTAVGADADAALATAVRAIRAHDPFGTVTVVTPNRYAALARRRGLARALGGLLDVRFLTLPTLVDQLGAPSLRAAGRVPATPAVRAEALRVLLNRAAPPLANIAHHPGARAAVDGALTEIAATPSAARPLVAGTGTLARALVDLEDALRSRLAGWYDTTDLMRAAIDTLRTSGIPPAVGHVVMFLPRPESRVHGELLRALADSGATTIIGFTGDAVADAAPAALMRDLGGTPVAPRPLPAANVVVAPDADGEARAAVQRVAVALESGVPLHRIAIVTQLAAPYARLARERLRDAGIPWSGPADRTLGQTAAGRVLGGLLDLATHWRRDAFAAWCAGAPVCETPNGATAPAHRFDVVSRAAGVVHGIDQWRERCHAYADRRRDHAKQLQHDPDASEGAIVAARTDADDADRLLAFVERVATLATAPDSTAWSEYARWARQLLEALVVTSEAWPEDDVRAADDLLSRIEALGALDAIGEACTAERFRAALEHELTTPLGPLGRFGEGVFVGTLHASLGLDFEVMVVIGANDRELPPSRRDDPLLPDAVRRAAGGALVTHDERLGADRFDWLAALATAPSVTVTCSRADTRAMRERRPARWLLELVEARVGHPVAAHELDTSTDEWCRVIPSFHASVLGAPAYADAIERDLAAAAMASPAVADGTHPLLAAHVQLAQSTKSIRHRSAKGLSEYDGLVGAFGNLLPADRAFSPTALETYARCPRQYFLAKALRLDEVPRPEAVDELPAVERGNLVHTVLEQFIARRQPIPSGHEWTDEERNELLALGESIFRDYELRGLTGRRLPTLLARRRLRRDLVEWLLDDNELRAEHGASPALLEHAFGFDGTAPVTVDAGSGRVLRLRGRIDRIDVTPDGSHAIVIDYKTGAAAAYADVDREHPIGTGNHLQLPVYAEAARAATGAQSVDAHYWFVSGRDRREKVGYPVDAAALSKLTHAVGVIADGIEAGLFPGHPGDEDAWLGGFDNCRYCPFDRVCPADRDEEWVTVRADDRLRAFCALTEGEGDAVTVTETEDGT